MINYAVGANQIWHNFQCCFFLLVVLLLRQMLLQNNV